jgi:lipopolysaccharide export system permease protein
MMDVLSRRLNVNGQNMQFSRYIFAQLLRTTCAVTLVIIGIVWLFQTIRLLEMVISRGAAFFDFILMSFAVIPLWLTIALPIGAFVAVNWVFHRILTDRELTVMQAIGLSPMQIARAPIALGALVSAAMLANSIFILPSSFGVYKEQQFKIRNSIPAILLQENVFVDVVDGMTMLIGKHGSNGVASDVFIHDTRNEGKIVTVLAETGQFIKTNGAPALVLQNGQRAELTDNTNNSAMLYFDSHTMSITATEGPKSKRMPIDMNEDTIPNLLNPAKSPSPDYFNERRAEGHYRIMSPFLGFALILIATALTLRGQIRRDLWGQRAFANIVVGIGTIILLVMSRSIATSTPQFIPLLYASILIPVAICLWSLSATRGVATSSGQLSDELSA